MRIAVISDVHSNLEALKTVIADIRRSNIGQVWCLGDVAGYGAEPNECIEELGGLPLSAVAGNHDLGAVSRLELDNFNPEGQQAIIWQRSQLSSASLIYLRQLPLKLQPADGITLVHGSPRDPAWEYLLTSWLAEENFKEFTTSICFFGHTHLPIVYKKLGEAPTEAMLPAPGVKVELEDDKARWLINPGSVGQPRDGNPMSCYIIFDDRERTLEYRRLEYPIAATQDIMRRVGLPAFLSDRLGKGI